MRFYEVFRPQMTVLNGDGKGSVTIPALRKFEAKRSRAKKTAKAWNDSIQSANNPILVRMHVVKGKANMIDFMNALLNGTKPIRVKPVGKMRRTDGRKWRTKTTKGARRSR